jgi:hypothetical protein
MFKNVILKCVSALAIGGLLLAGMGVGCSTDSGEADDVHQVLGIARFVNEESGIKSAVIGLDADGKEVGRVEIVHGHFALSPQFRDDYPTAEIDGRQLKASVLGQQLAFEVEGFDPLMQMPGHPPQAWALEQFLTAPEVKPLLDRWGLGFRAGASLVAGESPYAASGTFYGHDPSPCNGSTTCGQVFANGVFKTIGTCGGGMATITGERILRKHDCEGAPASLFQGDTTVVVQYCPAGSGGFDTKWWAYKVCPWTYNATECGNTTTSSACKGCASYALSNTGTFAITATNTGTSHYEPDGQYWSNYWHIDYTGY